MQLLSEERATCPEERAAYVEEVRDELQRGAALAALPGQRLYPDAAVRQVLQGLRQLACEAPEQQVRLRAQFERAVELNAPLVALFDGRRQLRDTF